MKTCPRCGIKFNLWQRAVGEDKEHLRQCTSEEKKDLSGLAAHCRGCPQVVGFGWTGRSDL